MNYINVLDEKNIHLLSSKKLISELKEYMICHKINFIMMNGHVLEINQEKFHYLLNIDQVSEIDNIFNLYYFFIKYQYYNLAAEVKKNTYCILKK
jgi:hypothetical protein